MCLEGKSEAVAGEIQSLLVTSGGDHALQDMLRMWVSERDQKDGQRRQSPFPLLTLLVCEAICGRWQHATPAAAAIELFVAASDLLDDVEDGDLDFLVGHGYNIAQAVNAASALLLLGQEALNRLIDGGAKPGTVALASQALASHALVACSGQHIEFALGPSTDISEDEYIRLVEMKSGALTECACRIGALLASDDRKVIESYALFGRRLGVAAQMANDVRSILDSQPGRSDIAAKKRTLPVIYGLKQANDDQRALLKAIFSGEAEITPESEAEVKDILTDAGAIQYTLVLAQMERQRALEALVESGIPSEANAGLLNFVGLESERSDG